MAQEDKIDTPRLVTIGIAGAFLVVATVYGAQVVAYRTAESLHEQHDLAKPVRALSAYQTEQQEKLNRYGWVNKDTQSVAIPIQEAMQLTVRDLQEKRQNAVVPATQEKQGAVVQPKPEKRGAVETSQKDRPL
jgi:hypothetical protein